jgi:muramoyltetrapeptide carboxypeptidase
VSILIPPRLKPGDLIGLVAPAGPVTDTSKIERGVRYLEKLGYRVLLGKHVTRVKGYLAGTDEQRAADLHAMFARKEVKAVFCVRGGYGTPRLLPLLDYALIARNPKILLGFSDITALQLALWQWCRLVTFHGPMLAVEMAKQMDRATEEWLWRLITSPQKMPAFSFAETSVVALHPGQARGRLSGGNLSLLTTLLGTPYEPSFNRALLFLEESHEEPYRVDRMLTQLQNAGVFDQVTGLLLGHFNQCEPKDSQRLSLTLDEVLREASARAGKPFLVDLPFGHIPRKMTLPLGLRARMDAGARQITFLEPAVQ